MFGLGNGESTKLLLGYPFMDSNGNMQNTSIAAGGLDLASIAAPDINVFKDVKSLPGLPTYGPTTIGVSSSLGLELLWQQYSTYIIVGGAILGLVMLTKRR